MKKLLLLLIPLFGMLTVESNAQTINISSQGKPIQLGDSVLVSAMWSPDLTKWGDLISTRIIGVEFKQLFTPTNKYAAHGRFAFFIYPTATMCLRPTMILADSTEQDVVMSDYLKRMFTITVLDKNGKEIRDSLSNQYNTPFRIRQVKIEDGDFNEAVKKITPSKK